MSLLDLPAELLSKIALDVHQRTHDFQSLALVNRRLYSICLPRLWQLISYPPPPSSPITFWIETVSPKHGHLVKTLVISFFDSDFYIPNPSPTKIETYYKKFGLGVDYHHEDLSPGSLFTLVKQCPNLQALVITDLHRLKFAHFGNENEERYLEHAQALFGLSMTPQSNLANIRRLTVYCNDVRGVPEEYLVELISHLPVLESVSCRTISERKYPEDTPSLGWVLSRLRYLKRLEIWSVYYSWFLYCWAAPLESLTLGECSNISSNVNHEWAHMLVNRFAKTLTSLDLCADQYPKEVIEPEDYCTLPKLTRLRLMESTRLTDTLYTYRNCKNIQHLLYAPPWPGFNWKLLLEYVAGSTWPHLKTVIIHMYDEVPSHYQADHAALVQFCQSAGIYFRCGNEDVRELVYDEDDYYR